MSSLAMFSMVLDLSCNRCRKKQAIKLNIYQWSGNQAERRNEMLDLAKRRGWVIPWTARLGSTGAVICPECAAKEEGGEG